MQQELDYPTESQIMEFQSQEFVNIRRTQEQINLLRRIANAISEDSNWSILSRLIILILLIWANITKNFLWEKWKKFKNMEKTAKMEKFF